MKRYRIYLLSPANLAGQRGSSLLALKGEFDLAVRLRSGNANLGETFAYISGLYFRGKLAYTRFFAAPPPGLPGAFVITAGLGLVAPENLVTLEVLRQMASTPIDSDNPLFRRPLETECRRLEKVAGPDCDFVLLGSVATVKYVDPLFTVFGERLLFPEEFAGRGDMSRGGLMLRCVREGRPLSYVPLGNMTRHGPRAARLV